ncbi:hypothetical protein TNCV_5074691 [Trichonephila clavipes]|nr:hypothetical protein TNCV_5074691 [Trichonephila clavipes]
MVAIHFGSATEWAGLVSNHAKPLEVYSQKVMSGSKAKAGNSLGSLRGASRLGPQQPDLNKDSKARRALYSNLKAANWSQCSLYPESNQRAASKLSVMPKNSESFTPRRSTIATPPGFHRPTNRRHATQQKGNHHSRHAPHQRLVMICV